MRAHDGRTPQRRDQAMHRGYRQRIFPNDDAIVRLVGALLLEQNDEWVVPRSRYMTLETIATIVSIRRRPQVRPLERLTFWVSSSTEAIAPALWSACLRLWQGRGQAKRGDRRR